MKYTKKLTAALALASVVAFSGIAGADAFTGLGDGVSWEDPANWLGGVVPLNNGSGNTFINNNFVEFDAATFASLVAAGNTQSATQYRVVRFLLNESTSLPTNGAGGITFDHGNGNEVLQTNGTSAVFGSRTGTTTVDLLSGTVNTGSSTTFGARDGVGILNLSDGQFIVGRGDLTLGNGGGSGEGFINVTGGSLLTRGGATLNNSSVFEVVGTTGTVGIGSQGSVDGFWTQEVDSILRPGLDGTGVTTINVTGANGDLTLGTATFNAGSILDPFDNGGFFTNVWEDVLFAGAGITDNGLTLSSTAAAAGFEQRIINGDTLQVRLVEAIPEPSSLALLGLGSLFFVGRRRRR